MPIDWDAIEQDLQNAVNRAAARTDDKLAGRISSLTRLTDEEVAKLFPKAADVERLARLMAIVRGAERKNKKIKAIQDNIGELAGTMLTLIDHLA